MSLLDKLNDLNQSDMLPLHMPGHKRNDDNGLLGRSYGIDITEIDEFDDLHNPEGILLDMEKQAARIYGSDYAFLSVNGSSAANEAAIMSMCKRGDKILIPRASHKSIYHAVEIGGFDPIYTKPKYIHGTQIVDAISVEDIEASLKENPDCKCVVITSPTYEGVFAQVSDIARLVHAYGGVLIVDSAHGAHLVENDNPINQGADLVITSLHKTLPAPTQTALLLVRKGLVDIQKVRHYLDVFQTSSPSYVLMAGMGKCLEYMEQSLHKDMNILSERITKFKDELSVLKNISVNPLPDNDSSKIVIMSKNETLSGYDIYYLLRNNHHIQCEMYSAGYCLAMLSVMDTEQSFERLAKALIAIDKSVTPNSECTNGVGQMVASIPERAMLAGKALGMPTVCRSVNKELIGSVSAAYCMAYPPGIPIIVPGEIIDDKTVDIILGGMEKHLNICGLSDGKMRVVNYE